MRKLATLVLGLLPAAAQQKDWSFNASALGYIVPDDRSYVSPVIAADRTKIHLEVRYNYENFETGSLWLGHNFSFGNHVQFEVTPMIGGVFGKSNGLAPGYLASVVYRRLSVESQGEYLFGIDRTASFFYNWSEVSYSPVDWFRAGLVIQRTKAYQTKLDLQRGFLTGFTYKKIDFTTYVFNLGWDTPTVVFGLGVRF